MSLLLKGLIVVCVVAAPIGILLVKPTAPATLKSGKLLFPIILLSFILGCISLPECFQPFQMDCVTFKILFIALTMLEYVTYIGWFEYIWRRRHKQIVWPLKENLKYGFASNSVIAVSAPTTFIAVFYFLFSLCLRELIR